MQIMRAITATKASVIDWWRLLFFAEQQHRRHDAQQNVECCHFFAPFLNVSGALQVLQCGV